jgi:hypothetical protein
VEEVELVVVLLAADIVILRVVVEVEEVDEEGWQFSLGILSLGDSVA